MYGLSSLMEALKQSETMENALNAEMELMEGAATDDVRDLFIGEDSVENDMTGNGMSEKEKKEIDDFISKIPPSKDAADDEGVEEALNLVDSYESY